MLNQDPLRRVHNKLNYGMSLTVAEIDMARAVIDVQRRIFRTTPRKRLAELAQAEQISIYLEDLKNG